jgi:hypothetical protein
VTSIAGPRTVDLVYARLGGITVVAAPEVSFGASLDRAIYQAGDKMLVRLTLRNTQEQALHLQFPSGQIYDAAITNEKGERVYVWSDGKGFTQVFQDLEIIGEQNFLVDVPLDKLAPGKYVLEAWLTTTRPGGWRASVPFDIR